MPYVKKDTGKNSKKKLSPAIITLIVLVAVAAIGFAGIFAARRGGVSETRAPENFVSYPTVSSSVASSKDGKSHTIDVDLVVEYKDGTQKAASDSAIYDKIQQTVSALDYERLRTDGSVEHIEETVRNGIGEIAGEDSVEKVYVGNLAIDFRNFFIENSAPPDSGANDRLRGLFKNLQ